MGFEELLRRAQRGDRDALGDIYVKYIPHVERVVRYRLRRAGLDRATTSEDIQDSVFCQLLRPGALDRITTEQHLLNFLLKACGNKVRDILAKHRSDTYDSRDAIAAQDGADDAHADSLHHLEHEEQLARIYAMLTPRERLLCMLRRAGYGWDEIAQRLNTTPVSARQAFSRGFRRARDVVRSTDETSHSTVGRRDATDKRKHSATNPQSNGVSPDSK